MGNSVFYFDDYCVDPLARELSRNGEQVAVAASAFDCLVYLIEHRERPVGKDELISAVWGRVDVSDNLLAQTIVRLRRSLGDAGNEQRCIKTIPRVGYRWMPEVSVVDRPTDPGTAQAATPSDETDETARDGVSRPSWLSIKSPKTRWAAGLLILFAAVAGCGILAFHRSQPAVTAIHFEQGTAVVLPAVVNGPQDWQWLHLGLMDLLSNQLRAANIPTENSQNVLHLISPDNGDGGAGLASFALVISPRAALIDNVWHVHLDAKSKEGRSLQAESSSNNVLDATRAASDLLLAQLGFGEQPGKQTPGSSPQEYLLRIEAAQLAGHSELARELIAKAPPDLRRTPELAFIDGGFYCDEGKLEPCERALNDLLKQLPADKPILRGKILTTLWYIYYRKHQFAEGEAALSEAVRVLQGQKDTEALAAAYLDRSHLEFFDGKLDQATADLGLARINYALAGDTVGQAKVDVSMAEIAMQRGQFAQALPLLQSAYEHYQHMGMRQLVSTPLQGLLYSYKMLLQYSDELATSDRYWPFDQKNMKFCDDYVRRGLIVLRAIALADNGRTSDASTLLQQLLAQRKDDDEPSQYAEVNAWLAQWALERGDTQIALSWIAKAMAGTAMEQDDDKRSYAAAWLTNVNVLHRAGKVDELKHTVAAMQAWVASLKQQDDWIDITLMRANAAAAWNDGNHERALEQLRLAMAKAEKLGVPELIVGVGQAYALALLNSGDVDQAVAISGRLSTWSTVDWRAAWLEACVYRALGQMAPWEKSRSRAQTLAGDREPLTEPAVSAF